MSIHSSIYEKEASKNSMHLYKQTLRYICEVCYHLNGTVFLQCDLISVPDRIQYYANKAFSMQKKKKC